MSEPGVAPGIDIGSWYCRGYTTLVAIDKPEIALAILAEIVAVRHQRSGGSLRDRPGPIQVESPEETPALNESESDATASNSL